MKEILIYDTIGGGFFSEGITDKFIAEELSGVPSDEEIVVRINSPGGDVFQGFAIFNLLAKAENPVTIKIDGLAASAASVIAMAGDSIEISDNAFVMIHDPMTMAFGGSGEMTKTAEVLDKIKGSIISTYQLQTGIEGDIVSQMMSDETWMNAAEAIDLGFVDKIDGHGSPSVENMAKPWFNHAPKVGKRPEQKHEPEPLPEFRIAARARFPVT